MTTDLTKFDNVRAEIAEYKEKNKNLVFDYHSPQGNKDARSHIFKLRKTKTLITDIHKEVKADALADCQVIDKEKRTLIGDVEEMIEVHAGPIRAIEEQEKQARLAQAKAEEEARRAEEDSKQKELADREADVARREAEIKAKEAEAERVDREKQIAEQAAKKARQEAEAKAKAEENARIAKEAAAAKAETLRINNENHRAEVKATIINALTEGLGEMFTAEQVVAFIDEDLVPNITINY